MTVMLLMTSCEGFFWPNWMTTMCSVISAKAEIQGKRKKRRGKKLSETAEEFNWAEQECWVSKIKTSEWEIVAQQKIGSRPNYFRKWNEIPTEVISKHKKQVCVRFSETAKNIHLLWRILYTIANFAAEMRDNYIWSQNLMALVTITVNIRSDKRH